MVSDDVFWQGCFYSFLREGNGLTAEGTWFEDDCLLRERQRIQKSLVQRAITRRHRRRN